MGCGLVEQAVRTAIATDKNKNLNVVFFIFCIFFTVKAPGREIFSAS
jgi:hypothetical protein